MKKKLETDINELEVALDHANKVKKFYFISWRGFFSSELPACLYSQAGLLSFTKVFQANVESQKAMKRYADTVKDLQVSYIYL